METPSRFFSTPNLMTSPLRLSPPSSRLAPSKRIPKTPLKNAIAPHVLTFICRHHVKVNEDDLIDESLLAFLHGYEKTSLKGDEYDLTFLEPRSTTREPRIPIRKDYPDIWPRADRSDQGRQVIISKIKAKPFSDRLGEALASSLDTEIRDDFVKFFVAFPTQGNTRTDSNFQSSLPRARPDRPSRRRFSIRLMKKA